MWYTIVGCAAKGSSQIQLVHGGKTVFKRKMLLIGISLLLLVGLVGGVGVQAQGGETGSEDDPWLQKPVLSYLLLTEDERLEREAQALFEALRLSEKEERAMQQIAAEEQQQVQALYQESQEAIQDKSRSSSEKQEAAHKHNERVTESMVKTDQAVRQLLGSRYSAFRVWIRGWWQRERQAIAKLKQPQGGAGTRSDGSNPRRMFTDIPLCWSEAEYAYYYGYNGGKDQFGRTVTVPCSVDLTPDVAADLGLGYLENSWLTVYYSDLP